LISATDLAAVAADGWRLPIGIAEADLKPVDIDFGAEPHLLVFGDGGSGKSSFLRTLAATITTRFPPDQARIVLIDYRRSLLGEINTEHLIGYASSPGPASELIDSVATYMRARMPGAEVTPAELKTRSWFTGPDCFVLVDDWDLVATGPNPVTPLLDLLAHARDIGLHLVVTRRIGGAARALYEPVLARLKDLGAPAVVMSGDRDEGPLIGSVRPQPLPPGRAHLVHRRDGSRPRRAGCTRTRRRRVKVAAESTE